MRKKGFTIIELLVAMALLVMMVALSSVVFSTAVKAYRTANATTEIMSRMRALTEQLDSDLRGLRKDMPVAIWFEYDPNTVKRKRHDQFQFFANGDFQSMQPWDFVSPTPPPPTKKETISGNTARIYYGHANQVRVSGLNRTLYRNYNYNYPNPAEQAREAILSRRVHLMTSLPMVVMFPPTSFVANFTGWLAGGSAGKPYGNDVFEYDSGSLSEWMNILSVQANADQYLSACFDNTLGRPGIDLADPNGESLHLMFCQGMGSFSIQWAYTTEDMRRRAFPDNDLLRPAFTGIQWWPSFDPDGDGNTADSDFGTAGMNGQFVGCYMQFPSTPTLGGWFAVSNCLSQSNWRFRSDYFPKALKFTFTIYDSKGIFPDGKTFTHIVYLN